MIIGFACLGVFLFMATLMYLNKLPALLALPLMALFIGLIGGIPGQELMSEVLGKGALKLHAAFTTTMFGAMLAALLTKMGITRQMIRWTAEYAGDNPFVLGLTMTLLTALLFTTLGGLGTVIMLGTIVLPLMVSVGVPATTAGGIFLIGISLGGMFNLGNWQLYIDVLGIPKDAIMGFVLPFGLIMGLLLVGFLGLELRRTLKPSSIVPLLLGTLILGGGTWGLTLIAPHLAGIKSVLLIGLGLLTIGCFIHRLLTPDTMHWYAFVTPIVPLLLVLGFGWEILPAFMAGLAYGALVTWRRNSINLLTQSIFEGVHSVTPAVVLIMGIGMLLNAVMHPKVAGAIAPLLTHIIPSHAIPYVVVFALIAPLSLYRGPLSLWGMGSGLVGIVQGTGLLTSPAIMGLLMSVGQIQGVCDPTNTQNVWVANHLGVSPQELLKKTLPVAWLMAVAGLVLAAMRYLPW